MLDNETLKDLSDELRHAYEEWQDAITAQQQAPAQPLFSLLKLVQLDQECHQREGYYRGMRDLIYTVVRPAEKARELIDEAEGKL